MSARTHSAFPPGFRRRIAIGSAPGVVAAGLEDDVHRFTVRIAHRDGIITDVQATTPRTPWSTCPEAGPALVRELVGRALDEVAQRDPRQQCTHLMDLAVLCAEWADHSVQAVFDLQVADRTDNRTVARLLENGAEVLRWELVGSVIAGPAPWVARDLRAFSRWKLHLEPEVALRAAMLRRAVMVSGARRLPADVGSRAIDRVRERQGACFTYQSPQVEQATQSPGWRRDFSRSADQPLQGLDPATLITANEGAT